MYLDDTLPRLSADPLEAPAQQQRASEDQPIDKAQVASSCRCFPSTSSLARLAGAVMCEQDEIWQESRYFSEVRINEHCDDERTRGIDGPVDRARLEAEARKILESGIELADRVETTYDFNRIPDCRMPGRLASDRALHQLSRHYRSPSRDLI